MWCSAQQLFQLNKLQVCWGLSDETLSTCWWFWVSTHLDHVNSPQGSDLKTNLTLLGLSLHGRCMLVFRLFWMMLDFYMDEDKASVEFLFLWFCYSLIPEWVSILFNQWRQLLRWASIVGINCPLMQVKSWVGQPIGPGPWDQRDIPLIRILFWELIDLEVLKISNFI